MTRVLIVADEANAFGAMERVCLARLDEFRLCVGADAALTAARETDFDFVVVASSLVAGADVNLVAEIRKRFGDRGGFVLIACRLADMVDPSRVLDCGADDYLFEPFNESQLTMRFEIAERRLVERAEHCLIKQSLRDTADQLALAAAATSDGFWHIRLRPDGSYDLNLPIWYSPRLKELFGFAEHEFDDVLGSWASRIHPADRERVFQAIDDQLYRRVPFDVEYRLQPKSGEYRWFNGRGQACWDSGGRPIQMAGSVRDVTRRRAEDDALRESEAQYRLITQSVDDIIWTVEIPSTLRSESTAVEIDFTMRRLSIGFVNPAIERVLGYSIEEGRDLTLDRLLTPTAYSIVLGKFLQEFGPLPSRLGAHQRILELDHMTRGGDIRCCEIVFAVIRDAEGLPRRITGVSRDITDRKRAEAALRREREFLRRLVDVHERDRQLLAYAIHDGVMPDITAALMHLESSAPERAIPRDQGGAFAAGLKLLRSAADATRRLIGALRPPILDEAGVVGALEYLVSEFRLEMPEVSFDCQVNFDRLAPPLENAVFRCVQEALSNVRRHSGCRRAEVRLEQSGNRLRVEVRDWGIGFDPAQVGDDRFGLQSIRERASLLGGRVSIDSAPGKGARICVDFPLSMAG